MSSGGGGLWFLIRVPTEDHERSAYGQRGTLPSTPATETKGTIALTRDGSQLSRNEEETEVKTRPTPALEQVLRKTLEELRIFEALWVLDKSEKFYQVSFTCLPGLPCDLILTSLTTNGIGMCKGSSLVILPCTVWLQDDDESSSDGQKISFDNDADKKSISDLSTLSKTKSEVKKAFRNFKDMQKRFLQTVTARLTVAQVVDGVRAGAEPTFDFIMFVLLASMIAALGLLENSSVIIVASMLISPIMGPILAGTFGAMIRDKALRNIGIKTEILGLFLCVAIGYVFGLASEAMNNAWGRREWPGTEMVQRGQERSLWIGVLIALPSGAGVALSVLAGNAGCLVGVAISASLLPPAVNAGLLWGMATVRKIREQEEHLQFVQVDGTLKLMKPSLIPFPGYILNYYQEMDRECAMLGLVSLGLALVNILCIVVAAVIVLKIKEVAPQTSVSRTSRFWKEDIKIARDYNTTMPATEADELGKQFLAEWATLNGLEPEDLMGDDDEAQKTRIETLKDIMQDVETDEVFQAVARSCTYGDAQPVSKRVSAIAPSTSTVAPPPPEKGSRVSAIKSWLWSSLSPVSENADADANLHPDLQDVELRRPRRTPIPPPSSRVPRASSRNSLAVLRQSLMHTDSPYTLWPSVGPEVSRSRFVVSPVQEESNEVTPIVRHRVSRFLQEPCVIVKETTC